MKQNNLKNIITIDDNKSFSFSDTLKQNLDVGLHAVKNCNQDLCIVFDGHEGAGKSQASRQIGYYCAKVLGSFFDVNSTYNIHNDLDSYVDSCIKNGKFYVSILDEGRSVLNTKRSLSQEAVRFTNFLSECRSQNQVHIIILPAYNDLDRYVALWRMSLLINMRKLWTIDDSVSLGQHRLILGNYNAYANNDNLRKIYDKKQFVYPKKSDFNGCFMDVEVLSEQGLVAYELQKSNKIQVKYGSKEEEKKSKKNKTDTKELFALPAKEINAYRVALYRRFCQVVFKYYTPHTTTLTVNENFIMEFFNLPLHVINRYSFKKPYLHEGDVDPLVFVGSALVKEDELVFNDET